MKSALPLAMMDAQRSLAFLVTQASYIEPIVYATKYPDIRYPQLVPVDTSAPDWVKSVTYFSTDATGQAAWFNGNAQDINRADVTRAKQETGVHMAGIGYGYDLDELGYAQLVGVPLTTDKANAARRISEEFIDQVALFGDAAKGLAGLFNNATVTAVTAAATGSGNSTLWSSKTPTQILTDFNNAISGIYTGSNTVEIADTVCLPITAQIQLSTTQLNSTTNLTMLQWLALNNVYTAETGQPLTIRGVIGLDTAGAGGSGRMAAYRRDPSVVKMHVPMPFRFMPAWQTGPIRFDVPGIFRLGGVDVKRPSAFRYVDGIC